jgi:hypothetical protein
VARFSPKQKKIFVAQTDRVLSENITWSKKKILFFYFYLAVVTTAFASKYAYGEMIYFSLFGLQKWDSSDV